MRKKFCLGTVVLSSVFFFACLLEEEAMPVPFPLPPPSTQVADTALPPPPAESAEPAPVAAPPKTTPPAPVAENIVTTTPTQPFILADAGQANYGRYTIQVAVFPSEASAKRLVKKMSENGIKAYYVKVNNPAQLLGTYYRVRVGYFSGKALAETFAKTKLEPLGYAWYIDVSRNDSVGNPKSVTAPVAPIAPVAPVAPVASSTPSTPSTSTSANSELEKAKQEYREIAKQASKQVSKEAAKQAPPAPAAPQIAAPPPPSMPKSTK